MARIKKSAINRSHKHRDLGAHITGEATLREEGVSDAPVENINWDVKRGEVHSDIPLEADEGWGKEVILRQFEYAFPPGITQRPTADDILTEGYVKFLESQLYFADNLELVLPPKVLIEDTGFKIFATCQPRKGHILEWRDRDHIQTLKQMAHDSAGNTD